MRQLRQMQRLAHDGARAIAGTGDGGHSPYAQALLKHIVELGMALRRGYDEVPRDSGSQSTRAL